MPARRASDRPLTDRTLDTTFDALAWPSYPVAGQLVPVPGDRRLGAAIDALRRRYGHGRAFVHALRDHTLLRLARLAGGCPEGTVPLWLLGAVALRAPAATLDALERRGDVRRVDRTPAVRLAEPFPHAVVQRLAASLRAAHVLPGRRATLAQVIVELQQALEQGHRVIVTPLGRHAFDPVWHGVSLALTAAGVSWIVIADEGDDDHPRPTVHLPVVGCFRSGPLRTTVRDAVDGTLADGTPRVAEIVAEMISEVQAMVPADPLVMARRLWLTGGGPMACDAPSWAA